jgi:hypothetical protein
LTGIIVIFFAQFFPDQSVIFCCLFRSIGAYFLFIYFNYAVQYICYTPKSAKNVHPGQVGSGVEKIGEHCSQKMLNSCRNEDLNQDLLLKI